MQPGTARPELPNRWYCFPFCRGLAKKDAPGASERCSLPVTYGSLGAVIILLLWFYCTGAALLFGAEFNSVIEEFAAQEGAPDAKARGERFPREHERREYERSSRSSSAAS